MGAEAMSFKKKKAFNDNLSGKVSSLTAEIISFVPCSLDAESWQKKGMRYFAAIWQVKLWWLGFLYSRNNHVSKNGHSHCQIADS